jgi:hypothetical protein
VVVSYCEVTKNVFEIAHRYKEKPIISIERLVFYLGLKESGPILRVVTPSTSELGFTPRIPNQQKSLDQNALFINNILSTNQRVGMTTHDTLCTFKAGRRHDELLLI